MSTTQPTFRFPFALKGESQEVQQAHIFAFNGLLDCQRAIASLKQQLTGASATAASAAASTPTTSESVSVQTSYIGAVNNQTGNASYTTQQSDNAGLIVLNDASLIAVTLATAPIISIPWYCRFFNNGTGTATLTPASGTVNYGTTTAAASYGLLAGISINVYFDGSNFWLS